MKINIKYYGNDESVYNRLSCSSSLVLSDQITSDQNFSLDEENQCIFLQVDGNIAQQIYKIQKAKIATIGKNIPFIVLGEHVHLHKYLQNGATEAFDTCTSINQIESRMLFLIKHHSYLPNSFASQITHFKLPIWKRIFDIIFASLALIALTPVLLITALLIRLESRGSVFYSSKRVGAGYKIFDFYKFRSMYPDADKRVKDLINSGQYKVSSESSNDLQLGERVNKTILIQDEGKIPETEYLAKKNMDEERAFFKLENDPRITKVGKFIRNTSIDELPQLLNVLKGDMSIVGNRPLPLYEAEKLTSDKWSQRFLAPAGLTGLWQVTQRAKSNNMSADDRKELDIIYARNFNFINDLVIILKTIPAMFQHQNV